MQSKFRVFLRPVILAALLAGAFFGIGGRCVAVTPVVAAPPLLRVDGNALKTPDGRTVRLQGVSIPSLEWSNEGEQILKSVQVAFDGWKANAVRIPLSQDRWFGMEQGQADGGAAYRNLVDEIVAQSARRRGYVVLDLHWSNGGRWKEFNRQFKMPDENSVVFWLSLAERYKNHPAVLFDMYNEPRDVSWEVWKNGGEVKEDVDSKEIVYQTPGMQKLLNVIRATGARNIVVASGLDWGYDLSGVANGYALSDAGGNGVMYATHIYPWKGTQPENWDPHVAVIADKYPILVGEVGAEPDPKQEDPMVWAPKILAYIKKLQLNWTAWSFHPAASPRIIADWNYTPTPYWGAFVKRALAKTSAPATATKPATTKPPIKPAMTQSPLVKPDALHARVRAELKTFTAWLKENKVRGFIGEVGWPDDAKGDAAKWNGLAAAWLRDTDAADLWVTTWATGEWWGTSYLLAPYENRDPAPGVDAPNTQAATLEAPASTRGVLRGVNVSGAEFGVGEDGSFSNLTPGAYDQKYHYDPPETFTFLAGRGLKLVRLPFRWERIQRTPGGELDADELRRLKETVASARRAGLQVVLDLHNYGEYRLSDGAIGVRRTVGSPEVSIAQFADVWRRLSREFKGESGVFYGLMNEPHDFPDAPGQSGAQLWEAASQAALDAIRAGGDRKLVVVPGYNWSGVRAWKETHPRSWIRDEAENFRYEAHHYWDRDGSGVYREAYDAEVADAAQKGFKP